MALFFIFRFAISVEYAFFFVYMNEVYPTQVRVLGLNFVSAGGSFVVTIFPQIASFCIRTEVSLMAVFAVLSAVSIYITYELKETLGVPPPDEI
jgi:MFS family permease